ncbi:Protein ROOT HAIR defective 3-like 2 [Vitis vinifera]|uniref:Protein ROOT HAIR defective 3-like 2 n=1 Tax=Vitis vinifera TaxID=29760 RepID=A0A438H194_VITVI|nr:Protein ROOT HAIR defective 3-like 2 [Vitis vinifera]
MDILMLHDSQWLAGLLAISSRFLPTVMNLLRRLAEEAQGNPTPQPPRPPPHLAYQSSRHHTQQSNPAFSLFPDSSVSSNISSSDGGIEHSEPQPDTKAKYKS